MAAKGTEAKEKVVQKIKDAFGSDYIGCYSNKHYVWVKENGEKIQIAIALTCPKNPVGTVDITSAFSDGFDFENTAPAVVAPTSFEPAEITEEEQANIAALLERLGL